MELGESSLTINRAQSSKTKQLSYSLDSFHCITSKNECAYSYCIVLNLSSDKQREIYFETEEAQKQWYEKILSAQGFSTSPIDQYQPLKNIDKGSFGQVFLAEHKLTKV